MLESEALWIEDFTQAFQASIPIIAFPPPEVGEASRALSSVKANDPRHDAIMAKWAHKNEGTPQTHERASQRQQGSLARMFMAGYISADQLAWAEQINSVHEMIVRDVSCGIVSYEPRIDCSASGRDTLVEGIIRVRRETAYSWWRLWIPLPRAAILEMVTGEQISYSAAAQKFGMGKKRARNMLIKALDLWPDALDHAEKMIDPADLAAAHAGLI